MAEKIQSYGSPSATETAETTVDSTGKVLSRKRSSQIRREDKVKDVAVGLYDVDDMVHEIADQTVPIYYYDIALYAANNFHLMQDIPDCGRECEPYKMIQMNIYEAICEGLYEHVAEKEKEDE